MQVFKPLNFIPYVKQDAEKFLFDNYGWESFQHKHHESRFTRFYEDFWLPNKFGYQKRRAHFSSLILTNQMTREEALERISKPEMSEDFLQKEFEYVADKLTISVDELHACLVAPHASYTDFKNMDWVYNFGSSIMRTLGLERSAKR